MEIQYPVALDSRGRLRWAHERDKGERYSCPGCGAPMILKAGEVRRPHFAHRGENPACGGETALHRIARRILADPRRPAWALWTCPECGFRNARFLRGLEAQEEAPIGPWRVDLLFRWGMEGPPLAAVEIVVTHPPSEEKIQDLVGRGIPVWVIPVDWADLPEWEKRVRIHRAFGEPCGGPWHPIPEDVDLRLTWWWEAWCPCGDPSLVFIESRALPATDTALERLAQELGRWLRKEGGEVMKHCSIRAASWKALADSEETALRAAAAAGRPRVLVQVCRQCERMRPAEVFRRAPRLEARFWEALRACGLWELPARPGAMALPHPGDGPRDGRLALRADFRLVNNAPVRIKDLPILARHLLQWGRGEILHEWPPAGAARAGGARTRAPRGSMPRLTDGGSRPSAATGWRGQGQTSRARPVHILGHGAERQGQDEEEGGTAGCRSDPQQ